MKAGAIKRATIVTLHASNFWCGNLGAGGRYE